MSKVFAFLSYGLNAGVMLVIALLLAKLLRSSEYSSYSFAVATAQMLAVCTFEWLRIAATRYYPGPEPENATNLRKAFLSGQYMISFMLMIAAFVITLWTGNVTWVLVTTYSVSQSLVDLQFTMLRFDARLGLFSRLQTLRGILSLVLVVSVAFVFRSGNTALLGGILANVMTILSLEFCQPGFVLTRPSRGHFTTLRNIAIYGVSAATAGGLYQFGPYLLRCAAFRGSSETSYAAFSLVADLMQRPYSVALTALNGVFFPDAVREHDHSPDSGQPALRLLYAIQVWCLLMIFGCAMAFRNELMPLIVKSALIPGVFTVFPFLSVFFLVHAAIQTTSALSLHLARAGFKLILQATIEFCSIATVTWLWISSVDSGIGSVVCSGMLGAIIGFGFTLIEWRTAPCRLPWKSWGIAFMTTVPLLVIGQLQMKSPILGLAIKGSLVGTIIAFGIYFGFAVPFGFKEKLSRRRERGVRPEQRASQGRTPAQSAPTPLKAFEN